SSGSDRVAATALFDTGTLAGSVFFQLTGQEAKAEDLNLANMALQSVMDEYAGGSPTESALRGVGSSLFQGLLFSRLGSAVGGTGASAQVSSAIAFGKGARDQGYAEASMIPMTEKSRKSYAGKQAAIETGVTLA